jgi:hypothetical protein
MPRLLERIKNQRLERQLTTSLGKRRTIADVTVAGSLKIQICLCDECYSALEQADAGAWTWLREHSRCRLETSSFELWPSRMLKPSTATRLYHQKARAVERAAQPLDTTAHVAAD